MRQDDLAVGMISQRVTNDEVDGGASRLLWKVYDERSNAGTDACQRQRFVGRVDVHYGMTLVKSTVPSFGWRTNSNTGLSSKILLFILKLVLYK